MKLHTSIPLFLLITITIGCSTSQKRVCEHIPVTMDSLKIMSDSQLIVRSTAVREYINKRIRQRRDTSFVDLQVNRYYQTHNSPFLWISYAGERVDDRADTLLSRLKECDKHGLKESIFQTEQIEKDLSAVRSLKLNGEKLANIMARLELNLTRAYTRYCCGMRYGFVNPRKLFNRFEKNNEDAWKFLYDVDIELPNEEFIALTREKLRNHDIAEFTSGLIPTTDLYSSFKKELANDKKHSEILAINMERCRWREKKSISEKYIFVNVAAFMLRAYNDGRTLEMKICCGQRDHKTPLLNSEIKRLELNPYWIVPHNIVKNEIVPNHTFDTEYFERNNMKIINRESGEEIAVEDATPEILLSNKYCIRQEKGEGNSLGRMIFRFPNNFSVYLHDTTNKGAFERKWRAVSHGCIRLEKPFELAKFLIGDDEEELLDRIRIAIDLAPETEYGQRLLNKEGRHNMNSKTFDKAIPVYLSYYTAYPSVNGTMEYFDDVYGYDGALRSRLK